MNDRRRHDQAVDTGMVGYLYGHDAWGHPVPAGQVRGEVVIGRDPRCGVVLTAASVSRQHARIVRHPGGAFTVEDLGSRNGTYLNGKPLSGPRELREGDVLQVGQVELWFRQAPDGAVPGLPRQPPQAESLHARGPTQPVPASSGHAGGQDAAAPAAAKGGAAKPLALAVLESLVGAAVSQALPVGMGWAYVLAIVTPLIGTAFALRENGRVRYGAVAGITAIAVALTVAGVTAADFKLGRSVFPWSTSESTFVPVPDEGTSSAPKVTMPKLVGYDNVSAMQLLRRAGFNLMNVLMLDAPSSRESFGDVVRTEPAAGQQVPNNAIVKIYLGNGRGSSR